MLFTFSHVISVAGRRNLLYEVRISSQFSTASLKHPLSVLFFGTDEYAVFALKSLLKRRKEHPSPIIRTLGVCSRFEKPSCVLAKFAREIDVPTQEYSSELNSAGYDVGLVASFGHLIPPEIINQFRCGILCIHPSLLPRWRGASPMMQTILHGDANCGVSLVRIMPAKFDVGPILRQWNMPLPENITSRQLGAKLMDSGVDLFLDVLEGSPGSFEVVVPQNPEGVTYAPKITDKKTFIDWNWDFGRIDRFQRALLEDFGVRTYWEDSVVRLTSFLPPDVVQSLRIDYLSAPTADSKCGDIYFHKLRKILFVRCADGWVGVLGLTVPDRRPLDAKDFYNGFLSPGKGHETFFRTKKSPSDKVNKV